MIQLLFFIDNSQFIYKGKRHEYGSRPFEEVWVRVVSVDKPTDTENR
jgi:hypothetical protein